MSAQTLPVDSGPAESTSAEIDQVRDFWNEHPCGAPIYWVEDDRRFYFEAIERNRYIGSDGREGSGSSIKEIAQFERFHDKDVLEIGCGAGTDGLQFARNGARYIGADLTPAAIALAREQFEVFGVKGRFEQTNAESLPLPSESLDHVYSFGVIHHSPNTEAIVREIHRVLRPGGTFCVMIYNRSSFYYRVEVMILRKIVRWMLRPSFMPSLIHRLTGYSEESLRDYQSVVCKRQMTDEAWLSINTDGPFCPLAKVYSHQEALDLFSDFAGVETEVVWPRLSHWPLLGAHLPMSFSRWFGRRWGFFRIVQGRKAAV